MRSRNAMLAMAAMACLGLGVSVTPSRAIRLNPDDEDDFSPLGRKREPARWTPGPGPGGQTYVHSEEPVSKRRKRRLRGKGAS